MSKPILGIIGGGQLGSMLAIAANKLEIKTVILRLSVSEYVHPSGTERTGTPN